MRTCSNDLPRGQRSVGIGFHLLSLAAGLLLSSGCSSMLLKPNKMVAEYKTSLSVEHRALQRFADSLQKQDLDDLKKATSREFARRSLRSTHSLDDLKLLRIPEGKVTIVKMDDEGSGRKRITAEVGENKQELFYDIVREESGRWVVDDVIFKQKRQGVTAYKSIGEQMDLLLSIREFRTAWEQGSRDEVLNVTSGDLKSMLAELPPGWLARVTKIVSDKRGKKSPTPDVQMDDDLAVVRLPRSTGEVVLTMAHKDDRWSITDLAVDSRDEGERIPSLLKQSVAILSCIRFLDAYEQKNRPLLAELCEKDFYDGSLAVGDFDQVRLPTSSLPEHELQVKTRGQRVEFTLKGPQEVIQLSFHRVELPPQPTGPVPPKYLVHDVTIYDVETQQQMQLSSLFTSRGMLELFTESIATGDWKTVKHCTTKDFAQRVWEPIQRDSISMLPLGVVQEPIDEILQTSFQGALTIYDVEQGGQKVRYYLREEAGQFLVDDIVLQNPSCPSSLKVTLETLLPVYQFARAINHGRDAARQQEALTQLQRNSSTDFNRIIWTQTEFVPSSGLSADTFLTAPVRSVRLQENAGVIELGDQQFGATVAIVRENEHWVIDDVQLIAGAEDRDRVAMKHTLREQLSHGTAVRASAVVPASHEVVVPRADGPRNRPANDIPRKTAQVPRETKSAAKPTIPMESTADPLDP